MIFYQIKALTISEKIIIKNILLCIAYYYKNFISLQYKLTSERYKNFKNLTLNF
jgi:hypothetical protein